MCNRRILVVDDDEKILKGIVRQQGDNFDITTAVGPEEALEILRDDGPFAVVVSDMRMPTMNGVQLLKAVREMQPNTVRMILTGFAELNSTIEAVNEGHIFRFLAKPCDEETMATSLEAGLRQYALIEAEKELVEGTLHGSVHVMADLLALVSPLAFGQSTRIRTIVDGMLNRISVEDQWQVEIAAVLSGLGAVTLPADLLQKKLDGKPLDTDEQIKFGKHPELASELLRSIPRLEEVSAIIAGQADGASVDRSSPLARKIQILKLAYEFDYRELTCESSFHALDALHEVAGEYDEDLFDALKQYISQEKNLQTQELPIEEVREGMVLADDVYNVNGTLLMSKGQKITTSAMRLLENFSRSNTVTGVIRVVSSDVSSPATV